jgi:methylthioribose-1-phosphate isomerase
MSLRVRSGKVELLDQRHLPKKQIWLPCDTTEQMWDYIKTLAVRGAPLIGCAAALALAVHSVNHPNDGKIPEQAEYLRTSRPTAVNLMYAVDKIAQKSVAADKRDFSPENVCKIAYALMEREVAMCDAMGRNGAALVKDGEGILTHCNTGSLATLGIGTALGVIREAHRQGKKIHVFVDETRPLLQGGRLTTFELQQSGIPYTLICDNMAASLMRDGKIQRVFVGADRVAMNGDFANKIGTYSVAALAHLHDIPFHAVAPLSTVDFRCESGKDIPIEEREAKEVHGAFGTIWAPEEAKVFNPAFDVTPAKFVTSLVLDTGVINRDEIGKGKLRELEKLRH